MVGAELVNLASLLDDAKCFALVRQHRWPEQVQCPGCDSTVVVRAGHDDSQPHRQRYRCNACGKRFDDLTGTVLAGETMQSRGGQRPRDADPVSSWPEARELGRCRSWCGG